MFVVQNLKIDKIQLKYILLESRFCNIITVMISITQICNNMTKSYKYQGVKNFTLVARMHDSSPILY